MGLGDDIRKELKIDREKKSVQLTEAPNIRKNEMSTFAVPRKFGIIQADLIYMKEESKGYKYVLVAVDVASRKMDAIPLKGRTHNDVIGGFEQIWKNNHIDRECVKYVYTDPGSEFKNKTFNDYMDDHGIIVRHTMTARKNQMGIVEYYNYIVTKYLGQKMTSEELEDKTDYSNWADDLTKIVEVLNRKKYEKEPKIKDFVGEPKVKPKEKILEEGTKVHVRLQQPIDHNVDDKKARLHGGFRAGDLRWEKGTTTITNVLIYPKQPVRYMVEKYKNVSFIRKELLVVGEQEQKPEEQQPQPQQQAPVQPQQPPTGPSQIASRTRSKTGKLPNSNSKYPNMV